MQAIPGGVGNTSQPHRTSSEPNPPVVGNGPLSSGPGTQATIQVITADLNAATAVSGTQPDSNHALNNAQSTSSEAAANSD